MLRLCVMQVPLVAALGGAFPAGWTGGWGTAQPARLRKAGTRRHSGFITDGWRKGAGTAVDAWIVCGDLAGSLTILRVVARR
jgi:hypothetical protein